MGGPSIATAQISDELFMSYCIILYVHVNKTEIYVLLLRGNRCVAENCLSKMFGFGEETLLRW